MVRRTLAGVWGGVALVAAVSCGGATDAQPKPALPVLDEAFLTSGFEASNLDSMAVWRPEGGRAELLVTAKATDELLVFDAADGSLLRRVGRTGDALGEFRRPNGIAIEGNLAVVVERDNDRVQVLALPDDTPVGVFGADVLRNPYGLTVYTDADGWMVMYITDNYETPEETVPPLEELGQRVQHFRVRVVDGALEVQHVQAFGDTAGNGVLRKVETIAADPVHNRVLVADEDETVRDIKVYTLDGRFTGEVIPSSLFDYEPEGLALYPCGDDGYWVATDQHPEDNTFHVLDRRTLRLLGSFQGKQTRQTDGISVVRGTIGPLTNGAVYAAHADAHVSAFGWDRVAAAAGIPTGCAAFGQ